MLPLASVVRSFQLPRSKRKASIITLHTIFCICLTTYLIHRRNHFAHHPPFTSPDHGIVVHGKVVYEQPKLIDPPDPFPDSPMTELPTDSSQNRPWLAAVICAAADVERRMIIRSTWMSIFKNVPFDGRFVISHPGQWRDIVAKENRTFGDMIVLDWLAEDDITANTIKTLEFYKWLATSGMRYEFVTKMDTDLWLNARLFWDRFLEPNTSNSTTGSLRATIDRTVIGELYFAPSWDLVFPHGAMYTVTWDMVELLAMLQHRFGVVTGEDMAVASLMLKGQETANFINFKGKEKFDYDDRDSRGDGTAWARARTHPNAIKHALVGDSIIAVHNLKSKAHWFKVAACFDKDGLIHQTPPPQTEKTPWSLRWLDFRAIIEWLSDAHRSRFDAIPEFLWSREDNIWVCDGIWRLGKTKTGYLA